MYHKKDEIVERPLVYVITLLLSFLWLLLIFTGPLIYRLSDNLSGFADLYYFLFHFTCHQMPSRCYWLFDYQLPVCVRCLGIYAGIFLGLIIYPFIKNVRSTNLPAKWWLLLCFVPIGIDGISSTLHLYASPHWLRLLTGILCGGVAISFVIPGLNDALKSLTE